MRLRRYNFGFTLMELVLVLAIVAVVAMSAAPVLRGFVRGRAAGESAGVFIAATQYARSQAVSDGTTYRLNIDTAAGKWWLTMMDGSGAFVDVAASNGQGYTLPETVRMQTDAPTVDGMQVIEFDPMGRSDPATVTFTGTMGNSSAQVTAETMLDVFHRVEEGP